MDPLLTPYNSSNHFMISVNELSKKYIYKGLFSNFLFRNKQKEIQALSNITFQVKMGEIVGIIGKNGSGKSTLMKILSRVTQPSSGTAQINGSLFAAIEVTGGFHPDLSGYENVKLTAKIWGMSSKDIELLLPQIIEFSELTDFIHLPIKKYSTGMISRLASSLIVHSTADIYLLDEILNGSDLSFRRKMHKKIIEENKKGKTILLASHTINDILALCKKAILIDKGEIVFEGNPFEVFSIYRSKILGLNENMLQNDSEVISDPDAFLTVNNVSVNQSYNEISIQISIKCQVKVEDEINFGLIINNNLDTPIAHSHYIINKDIHEIDLECKFSSLMLNNGNYFISIASHANPNYWVFIPRVKEFKISHEINNSISHLIPGIKIENATWAIK